jgi:hypothetical protein
MWTCKEIDEIILACDNCDEVDICEDCYKL